MHKILYGNAPVYLKQCFHYANSEREYNLRRSENLIFPKPKTEYLRKSLTFSGVKVWNSLPVYLKNKVSLSSFKRELASLSSYNYSPNNFNLFNIVNTLLM